MNIEDLPAGTHFWGLCDNRLAVFIKDRDGDLYVCGGWECTIYAGEIEFVSIIENPKPEIPLYYL
jgi:hypothetical protein